MVRLSWLIFSISLLVVALSGCGPTAASPTASPTPTPPPEPPTPTAAPSGPLLSEGEVTFVSEDGIQLSGTVFGSGRTAVVLAHMRPVDQRDWHPFAEMLAERGFTALTFDFRGYGKSGGTGNVSVLDRDVRAAIAFLRDAGFQAIFCVGASMGGTACAKAGGEPGLVGLIMISSPTAMEPPLQLTAEDFADLTYPKLFTAAEQDQPYRDMIQTMYDASPEPKEIRIFAGNAHGTLLFQTEHAEEFQELLIDFLESNDPSR